MTHTARMRCQCAALAAGVVVCSSPARADDGSTEFIAGVLLFGLVLYLIPTWVAFARRHPNRWPIAVINIALGGTGLGWLGSLVWALSAVHRSPTGNHGGESGLNLYVNDVQRVSLLAGANNTAMPPALAIDDFSERLLKLKKLRDDEVISADEYQKMRKPIVEAMQGGLL